MFFATNSKEHATSGRQQAAVSMLQTVGSREQPISGRKFTMGNKQQSGNHFLAIEHCSA